MNLTDPIFHDADKARSHLEATRWPNGPICPHCGVVNEATALQGTHHRAGLYQCNACRQQFTATVGTVFERSKVPLNKWLLASYLMASSKKGVSAHQLHRTLGVTYKTAWFMAHRLREAMREDGGAPLGGEGKFVEADETYVGGKEAKHKVVLPTIGVFLGQPDRNAILDAALAAEGIELSQPVRFIGLPGIGIAVGETVQPANGLHPDVAYPLGSGGFNINLAAPSALRGRNALETLVQAIRSFEEIVDSFAARFGGRDAVS